MNHFSCRIESSRSFVSLSFFLQINKNHIKYKTDNVTIFYTLQLTDYYRDLFIMSSSFIKIGFMAACFTFSLSSTTGFAKEYYKWVDTKGSTHYTTTPPPKSAQKKGKVDTYGSNTLPQSSKNTSTPEAERTSEVSQNQANVAVAAANAAPAIAREADRSSNSNKVLSAQ